MPPIRASSRGTERRRGRASKRGSARSSDRLEPFETLLRGLYLRVRRRGSRDTLPRARSVSTRPTAKRASCRLSKGDSYPSPAIGGGGTQDRRVVSARERSIEGRFARLSASIARTLFARRGVERGSSARRAPPHRTRGDARERRRPHTTPTGACWKIRGNGVARGCRDTSRAAAAVRQRGASSRSPPLRSRRASPSGRATRSRATFARAARRRRPRASFDLHSPCVEPTLAFHRPHRPNPLPLRRRRRAPTATPRTRSGHPCPTASSCASSVPGSTADSASTSASSGARPNIAPRERRVSFPELPLRRTRPGRVSFSSSSSARPYPD